MRVQIRTQVDVALCPFERAKKLPQMLGFGITGHHSGDHESRIDDLSKAQLLRKVVGAAEQRGGFRFACDQPVKTVEQHPVCKCQNDLVRRHILLERLDGGVMAARLVSDGYGNARSEERRVGKECRSRWWGYQ